MDEDFLSPSEDVAATRLDALTFAYKAMFEVDPVGARTAATPILLDAMSQVAASLKPKPEAPKVFPIGGKGSLR